MTNALAQMALPCRSVACAKARISVRGQRLVCMAAIISASVTCQVVVQCPGGLPQSFLLTVHYEYATYLFPACSEPHRAPWPGLSLWERYGNLLGLVRCHVSSDCVLAVIRWHSRESTSRARTSEALRRTEYSRSSRACSKNGSSAIDNPISRQRIMVTRCEAVAVGHACSIN